MQFNKNFNLAKLISVLFFLLILVNPVFADVKLDEFDSIRLELSYLRDKNSPQYIKLKQKLDKFILKNKINYTNSARIVDVQRLIQEQKFKSAIWELNELIENGYELSLCYELLGDISQKSAKAPRVTANYYKDSLKYDNENISSTFKLAKLYLKEKKNIIAIEYLKQCVSISQDAEFLAYLEDIIKNKITPKDRFEANNLYETLGMIYEKSNKLNEAYVAYSKALQINQNDIYLKYHFANLLYENNENKAAIELYNSILNLYPADNQIKTAMAKSYAKDGNILNAQKQYQEILQKYPNSAQAKYGLYKMYENKYSPDIILEKIYFNNKNFKPTIKDLKEFALFLADMGDVEAASNFEKCANNIEELEKQKLIAQKEAIEKEKLRQQQLLEQKKQKQIQEQNNKNLLPKKTSIAAKPASNKVVQNKVKVENKQSVDKNLKNQQLLKEERLKQEKLRQEKIEKDRIAKEKIEKEKIRQAKLKSEKEKKLLEQKAIEMEHKKAIAKDPKKHQELTKTVQKYLAINPKTTDIYIAIANTYKQMNEPTTALKYLNEAKKQDAANSEIYYNIGLLNFEQNKLKEAKNNLVKAINLDTENMKAKNLLAFVNQGIVTRIVNDAFSKYEAKDYIKAYEILDSGIKEYPKTAQLYFYRGLVYTQMNRNAAAIYDFQKSIELDPAYYMAYYHLGKTYEKIKDERNALMAYERFLSIEPDEKELIDEIEKKVVSLGVKYY